MSLTSRCLPELWAEIKMNASSAGDNNVNIRVFFLQWYPVHSPNLPLSHGPGLPLRLLMPPMEQWAAWLRECHTFIQLQSPYHIFLLLQRKWSLRRLLQGTYGFPPDRKLVCGVVLPVQIKLLYLSSVSASALQVRPWSVNSDGDGFYCRLFSGDGCFSHWRYDVTPTSLSNLIYTFIRYSTVDELIFNWHFMHTFLLILLLYAQAVWLNVCLKHTCMQQWMFVATNFVSEEGDFVNNACGD